MRPVFSSEQPGIEYERFWFAECDLFELRMRRVEEVIGFASDELGNAVWRTAPLLPSYRQWLSRRRRGSVRQSPAAVGWERLQPARLQILAGWRRI